MITRVDLSNGLAQRPTDRNYQAPDKKRERENNPEARGCGQVPPHPFTYCVASVWIRRRSRRLGR